MNATELRKITEEARVPEKARPEIVERLVNHAEREMVAAARRKEHWVDDPIGGLRLATTPEDREAAYGELRARGFIVKAAPMGGTGRVRVEW